MKVHVIGPNLPTSDVPLHVHAEGCRDVQRSREYASREFDTDRRKTYDVDDVREMVELFFCHQIEESDGHWTEYVDEFRIFPCADGLPDDASDDA